MIVIDRYFDAKTGEYAERELEIEGVITEKEAIALQEAEDAKQAEVERMTALREKLIEAVVVGDPAAAEIVAEYRDLREKYADTAEAVTATRRA